MIRNLTNLPWILLACSIPLVAAELHVSPDGDDAGDGSRNRPVATLHRVQELARRLAGREELTVRLAPGTYELDRPLVFTAADSGTAGQPVVWMGDPQAKEVTLSGGRELSLDWRRYREGILQAKVPDEVLAIDQLFINGKRRWLARWPDFKAGRHGFDSGYAKGLSPVAGAPISQVDPPLQDYAAFRFDPEQFSPREWKRPDQALIHVFQANGWGNMQWRLRGLDRASRELRLGEGGWQIGTLWESKRANLVTPGSKFYVENVFEELDAPGEWYFNAEERALFYLPEPGEDMTQATVTACVIKELIVVEGSVEKPVRHLEFRNLTLSQTARTLMEPYETRLRGDWAIARRAAVRIEGAEDCVLSNCAFEALGGNGLLLSGYNRRIEVSRSLFQDLGDSAVLVVGSADAVREHRVHRKPHVPLDQLTDLEPGPKTPAYPGDCRIVNNLMHDLGVFGKQVAGVYLSAAEDIEVSHNTICRIPRAGICINDGCWGGHRIEFNDLFLTVLETSDHGPINAWGRDRFWQTPHRLGEACDLSLSREYAKLDSYKATVIRHNRLRHEEGFSWGIDLDDGASNYRIEGNLCIGCSMKLREGYFRTVRNNIFTGGNPPSKHACFEGSDDVFAHNIYVNTRDAWALNRGPTIAVLPVEIDRNLYFNTIGGEPLFGFRGRKLAFPEWQALGADRNSVFANPEFLNLEHGDYRLAEDSPALKLGFKPFPLDRFGVQEPPENKSLAARLRSTQDDATAARADYEWMGMLIRNGASGVLVRAAPSSSDGYRAGFREGDVLIRMNAASAANIDALTGIISGAPIQTTEFGVTRRGKPVTITTNGPGGTPSHTNP